MPVYENLSAYNLSQNQNPITQIQIPNQVFPQLENQALEQNKTEQESPSKIENMS